MSDVEVVLPTVEHTAALGAAVGRLCAAGDVVALVGDLGAGKTQFVRGLAQGMGIDPRHVSSPTFVIAHEYESADAERVLVHIDAYRLNSGEELAAMGYAGAGGDLPEGAVLAIEWADRVAGALPADRLDIVLEHADAGRRATIRGEGRWSARIMELETALKEVQP